MVRNNAAPELPPVRVKPPKADTGAVPGVTVFRSGYRHQFGRSFGETTRALQGNGDPRTKLNDPNDMYSSTYKLGNDTVCGENKDTRKVVGYSGHVPQLRFQTGHNYQDMNTNATHQIENKRSREAALNAHGTAGDVEAPYHPRTQAQEFKPKGGPPVGYRGYRPRQKFEFGQNHATLNAPQPGSEHEDPLIASTRLPKGTQGPAKEPDTPAYKPFVPTESQAPTRPDAPIVGYSGHVRGYQFTHGRNYAENMTYVGAHLGNMGKGNNPEVRVHDRDRDFNRTETMLDDDDDVPSYLKSKQTKEGPDGKYIIPGYTGHFKGREFDLGQSFASRTRDLTQG
eukprot:TRINITY_DN6700_c0_g1_i2.p1 TRINITY_DN6700_c0_g1~~TRINITY_DN6700_c0_g1_i2.p1  ORF type:complete len:340 (-),score=68.51 TRINITY_DN6700_c0_g1_i2:651-1670(-)